MNLNTDCLDYFDLEVTNEGNLSFIKLKKEDFTVTVKHEMVYEKLSPNEDKTIRMKYEISYNDNGNIVTKNTYFYNVLISYLSAIFSMKYDSLMKERAGNK